MDAEKLAVALATMTVSDIKEAGKILAGMRDTETVLFVSDLLKVSIAPPLHLVNVSNVLNKAETIILIERLAKISLRSAKALVDQPDGFALMLSAEDAAQVEQLVIGEVIISQKY